jgi:hypothetical protein
MFIIADYIGYSNELLAKPDISMQYLALAFTSLLNSNREEMLAMPIFLTVEQVHERTLPWTPRSLEDFLNAYRLHALPELFSIDPVTIPNQKTWCCMVRKCLDHLIFCPQRCRMFSHIEMHYASAMMGQDNQHKLVGLLPAIRGKQKDNIGRGRRNRSSAPSGGSTTG